MSGHGGRATVAKSLLKSLRRHLVGQAAMFTLVGAVTTLVNALVYTLLRVAFNAPISNILSVLITTIGSSAVLSRFVFQDRDKNPTRMHLQSIAVFVFYCVSNQVALWLLDLTVSHPSSTAEAVAVSAMALFGGISRFVALRVWVFARGRKADRPEVLNAPTQRSSAHRSTPSAAFPPAPGGPTEALAGACQAQ